MRGVGTFPDDCTVTEHACGFGYRNVYAANGRFAQRSRITGRQHENGVVLYMGSSNGQFLGADGNGHGNP